jgi:MGT family glycosyltransferase
MIIKPHIACFVIPAHGHINPTLPVVAALVARGYRVTYPTTQPFAAKVARSGAEVVLYESKLFVSSADDGDQLRKMRKDIIDEIASAAAQLQPFYLSNWPDLILYDQVTYVGELLSIRLGVRSVRLWSTFANNEHYRGVRDGAPQYESIQLQFMQCVQDFFTQQGIAEADRARSAAVAHIAFLPRVFQHRGETFDHRYHFVGPCLGPRHDGEWQPPTGERPVLLISLGTIFAWPDFFKMCIEAFADSRWHVVLVTGSGFDPAALGTLPSNIEAHRFVPQLSVLQHAKAFICHGGMNGVMEALYYGVPIIAILQKPEQETIARRLVELGVGRSLPRSAASAAALRTALTALCSDALLPERMRQVQALARSAGGAERAAEAIEQALLPQVAIAPVES